MKTRFSLISAIIMPIVLFSLIGCSFFSSFKGDDGTQTGDMSFDQTSISLMTGQMQMLNLSVEKNQRTARITWSYDESLIEARTDNYGIVITGLKEGKGKITASCGNYEAVCIISVSGERYSPVLKDPYIYANTDIVTVKPGETQKIFASAYGKDIEVLNSWQWVIDKPSIASITSEGNYCWINGITTGQCRLTIKNPQVSNYGYSVLINVAADVEEASYLTTTTNVVNLSLTGTQEKEFSVQVKNPISIANSSDYSWSFVDGEGKIVDTSAWLQVEQLGNVFKVRVEDTGMCIMRISHPDALYSLDVIIRASLEVDNIAINSTETLVEINGSGERYVSFSLVNCAQDYDSDEFEYSLSQGWSEFASYYVTGGSVDNKGDTISIVPRKNGMFSLTVRHPLSNTSRTVMFIIRNMENQAANAETYVTTSQNFINLYEGDEPYQIGVTLVNTSEGRENALEWSIESKAADGSTNPVVEWLSGTGTYKSYSSSARSISLLTYDAIGNAYIKPLKKGTAHIHISHPDAIYDTEIIVNVLEKTESVNNNHVFLYTSNSMIRLYPGNESRLSISVSGAGEDFRDELFDWNLEGTILNIEKNGRDVIITYPSKDEDDFTEESGILWLTVSHPDAQNGIRIPVLYATNTQEMENLAILMPSSLTSPVITPGYMTYLAVDVNGIDEDEIRWTIDEGAENINLKVSSGTVASVEGIQPGTAVVTASHRAAGTVSFVITVKDDGIIDPGKAAYLTTTNNVVYFNDSGLQKSIEIKGINITDEALNDNLTWTLSNNNYKLTPCGNVAIIESLAEDVEAELRVGMKNNMSKNELIIKLRTGNQYIYKNEDYTYISADRDTIQLTDKSKGLMLTTFVLHTESDEKSKNGISFEIENDEVAALQEEDLQNIVYVKPVKPGSTMLTVHAEGCLDLQIPVIVKPVADFNQLPYITTASNVVTIVEGESKPISVTLNNMPSNGMDLERWKWTSANRDVADVMANSGSTVILHGYGKGTTKIVVTNDATDFPLEIIVICIDESVAAEKPYIQTSQSIISLEEKKSTTITAEMIGGDLTDASFFRWTCSDPSVALVSSTSDSCYIKGLSQGTAIISVTNTRYPDAYPKSIIVRVEKEELQGSYIELSENIVKMDPYDTKGKRVSANLINGETLDSQDYTWWTDDPSLINLTATTNTAEILPTGRTGVAKVYVKHPKVAKQVELIVLLSKYQEFSFEEDSFTITAGTVYFKPVRIPATNDDVYVTYSSSDESIVAVAGTDKICYLEGLSTGNAVITAYMKSKTTDAIISQTNSAVYVKQKLDNPIRLSIPTSLLTLEIDSSTTVTATLSGKEITEADSARIKWNVLYSEDNQEDGLTLLQPSDGILTGDTAYITAHKPGDYILQCTYNSKDGEEVTANILIAVPEAKQKLISLEKADYRVYRSDGSFKVKAYITNGTPLDYNSITWTATRYNSKKIVTITESGQECTVYPSGIGTTVLTARMGDGTSAQTIVTILPDAILELSNGTIHVTPGMSEKISYKITPEDASVNWLLTQAGSISNPSDYIAYSVDTNAKEITITAKGSESVGLAGQLVGYLSGSSGGGTMPKLNIYVEYEPFFIVDKSANFTITNPDEQISNYLPYKKNGQRVVKSAEQKEREKSERTITYTVYPSNMDIDIKISDESKFEISSHSAVTAIENGRTVRKGTIHLLPHAEGEAQILITGKSNETVFKYTGNVTLTYEGYDLSVSVADNLSAGAFSYYDSNARTIHLGDGESVRFSVNVDTELAANANISKSNIKVELHPVNGSTPDNMVSDTNKETASYGYENHLVLQDENVTASNSSKMFVLSHNYDYTNLSYFDSKKILDCENDKIPEGKRKWFYINKELVGQYYTATFTPVTKDFAIQGTDRTETVVIEMRDNRTIHNIYNPCIVWVTETHKRSPMQNHIVDINDLSKGFCIGFNNYPSNLYVSHSKGILKVKTREKTLGSNSYIYFKSGLGDKLFYNIDGKDQNGNTSRAYEIDNCNIGWQYDRNSLWFNKWEPQSQPYDNLNAGQDAGSKAPTEGSASQLVGNTNQYKCWNYHRLAPWLENGLSDVYFDPLTSGIRSPVYYPNACLGFHYDDDSERREYYVSKGTEQYIQLAPSLFLQNCTGYYVDYSTLLANANYAASINNGKTKFWSNYYSKRASGNKTNDSANMVDYCLWWGKNNGIVEAVSPDPTIYGAVSEAELTIKQGDKVIGTINVLIEKRYCYAYTGSNFEKIHTYSDEENINEERWYLQGTFPEKYTRK